MTTPCWKQLKFALDLCRAKKFLTCDPLKTCHKFPQFEFRRALTSVISIFSTRDKCILVVILNNYKTVWGNLEIPFLVWVIFNNIFSHKKRDTILFKIKYLFFSDLCELVLAKNWRGDKFFKFRRLKFWERQFFSRGIIWLNIWHYFIIKLFVSLIDLKMMH